jgi:hypothetical protein
MAELARTRWSSAGGRCCRFAACLGAGDGIAAAAAAVTATWAKQRPPAAGPEHLFGEYLAGRHAQQSRDFTAAAGAYEKATRRSRRARADQPDVPHEVCVGQFDRARALPKGAEPIRVMPRRTRPDCRPVWAGDTAGALETRHLALLGRVHRVIGPFALA